MNLQLELASIWECASRNLAILVGEDEYQRWFADAKPVGFEDSQLRLAVRNILFIGWIERHFKDKLLQACQQAFPLITAVNLEQAAATPGTSSRSSAARPARQERPARPAAASAKLRRGESPGQQRLIDEDGAASPAVAAHPLKMETFDNFIVGDANRLALVTAQAVAENPGMVYNPLFIYGPTGLGKTHLLRAIQNEVIHRQPGLTVEYMSSEDFMNLFTNASRSGELPGFRNRFRKIDVLLIDDVQFLKGKTATQDEFFHTFNALQQAHKQIVLTSDRSPSELDGLPDRLVTRFAQGLSADIGLPDFETRLNYLRMVQGFQQIKLEDKILQYIASNIRSSFRNLKGALVRVVTQQTLLLKAQSGELTIDHVRDTIAEMIESGAAEKPSHERIIRTVAEYYGLSSKDILSKKRTANIAMARHVAMYISRELTGDSLPVIGDTYGRNHSTVVHGLDSVKARSLANEDFRALLLSLKKRSQNAQVGLQ